MSEPNTITLNGKAHPVEGVQSISDLLQSLGLEEKPVVVELNHEAVFPRDYQSTEVCVGAQVEIVALAAGG